MSLNAIAHVPGPWKLRGDVHVFFTYTTNTATQYMHNSFFYEPLEAKAQFSIGKFVGGFAGAFVIRYKESPLGPYDELIIVPGSFATERRDVDKHGNSTVEKVKRLRITRIYVSTKASCYNGRKSKMSTLNDVNRAEI